MDNTSSLLLIVVCIVVSPLSYYWIEVARRKRQQIRFKLRRIVVYCTCVLTGSVVIPRYGYGLNEAVVFSMFVGLAMAFVLVRPPNRNRRIPRGVRQAVIARDLRGVSFDANLHEIDHIVPFSKGGDHSVENLRVIPRADNRRRGAQMPKLRDLM